MNEKIKLGKYRHYKGKMYEVVGVAKHSETLEELVVYRALYGNNELWARPLNMFLEMVPVPGGSASGGEVNKKVPRFEFDSNVYGDNIEIWQTKIKR